MMSFVSLLLMGILFPALQAKQFTKCELSQVLKDMDGYGGVSLPECEFSAALFHPILHLLLSSTLLPLPIIFTFIQLFNNPLFKICLLLIPLFSYIFFLSFSDLFGTLLSISSRYSVALPYLETCWRAIFSLGIQVLIYAVPGHLCDTFLPLPQGSVTYSISVVTTRKL